MAKNPPLYPHVPKGKQQSASISPAPGMKVDVYLKDGRAETLRNVTEIHYSFPSAIPKKQVAFESNIHATGLTFFIDDVREFVVEPEKEIAPNF